MSEYLGRDYSHYLIIWRIYWQIRPLYTGSFDFHITKHTVCYHHISSWLCYREPLIYLSALLTNKLSSTLHRAIFRPSWASIRLPLSPVNSSLIIVLIYQIQNKMESPWGKEKITCRTVLVFKSLNVRWSFIIIVL